MKKSKRFEALFAAVLMAITMFTGSISAYAAAGKHDPSVPIQLGSDTYSSLTITGWRSINSTTSMKAQTTANKNAYRIAVTMVPRTVDSKGNLVKAGGKPDRSLDGKNASPVANVTSGSGKKFTSIYILFSALTDKNLDHCASTEYKKTFWQIKY